MQRSTTGDNFFGLAFISLVQTSSRCTLVNVRQSAAAAAKSFYLIILGLAKVNRGNS